MDTVSDNLYGTIEALAGEAHCNERESEEVLHYARVLQARQLPLVDILQQVAKIGRAHV